MQLSMANQQNTNASIKNLETQMGEQAQHLSQISQQLANQQGRAFTANTQNNLKNEQCKAITTRSGKVIGQGIDDNLEAERRVVEKEDDEGKEKEEDEVHSDEDVNNTSIVENEKVQKNKKK
jgi:uncharacterized coiled-coil protein SlyX